MQPNGVLRDVVCRGMMLHLHREGLIGLPPIRRVVRDPLVQRRRPVVVPVDECPLEAKLKDIQPIEFRQVRRTPEEALFNSLLEQYHYLRYTQSVGEHLKFLIYTQGRSIACLAWSSAPRHLGARDRYIGWSAEARRRNIRFLAGVLDSVPIKRWNSRYITVLVDFRT